jgi:hypothetical protein
MGAMSKPMMPEAMSAAELYAELLATFSPDGIRPVADEKERRRVQESLSRIVAHESMLGPLHTEEKQAAGRALCVAVADLRWQAQYRGELSRADYAARRRATVRRWNKAIRDNDWQTLCALCEVCHDRVVNRNAPGKHTTSFVCSAPCRLKLSLERRASKRPKRENRGR